MGIKGCHPEILHILFHGIFLILSYNLFVALVFSIIMSSGMKVEFEEFNRKGSFLM